MPGRPNIKRRMDASERSGKHRVSKAGKKITYGVCKQTCHNKELVVMWNEYLKSVSQTNKE